MLQLQQLRSHSSSSGNLELLWSNILPQFNNIRPHVRRHNQLREVCETCTLLRSVFLLLLLSLTRLPGALARHRKALQRACTCGSRILCFVARIANAIFFFVHPLCYVACGPDRASTYRLLLSHVTGVAPGDSCNKKVCLCNKTLEPLSFVTKYFILQQTKRSLDCYSAYCCRERQQRQSIDVHATLRSAARLSIGALEDSASESQASEEQEDSSAEEERRR